MTAFRTFLIVTGLVALQACDRQPRPSSPVSSSPPTSASKLLAGPPDVLVEQEEADEENLTFYVQAHRRLPDGSQSLRVAGTHGGNSLGLEIVLGASWTPGTFGEPLPFKTSTGWVAYRSTGSDSNSFVRFLDELYRTKRSPQAMAAEVRFEGISLGGDPGDLTKGPVHLKLFLEGGASGYAEIYTNIDLPKRRLEIREKDESYRLPLLNALGAR